RCGGVQKDAGTRSRRGRCAHGVGALGRDDAGEREVGPGSEAATSLVGTTGEAVQDRAGRYALSVEDVERVVPRLARVHDQRQVLLEGQSDLIREHAPLYVTRRVVVVVVEPALADGDDLALAEQGND